MSLHEKSIAELAAGLRQGAFSSVELVRHYLERIERQGAKPVEITFDDDGPQSAVE